MITTAVERLEHILDEVKLLLPEHYEKLALDKSGSPLDPMYEVYLEREQDGQISVVTLRDNGQLIGYWVAFICPGLHYRTVLTSTMDIWNVKPEYAHTTAPLRLIKAVEAEMRRRGVKRWFAGEKLHKPCGRLFEAVGMRKIESTYSKWLGT